MSQLSESASAWLDLAELARMRGCSKRALTCALSKARALIRVEVASGRQVIDRETEIARASQKIGLPPLRPRFGCLGTKRVRWGCSLADLLRHDKNLAAAALASLHARRKRGRPRKQINYDSTEEGSYETKDRPSQARTINHLQHQGQTVDKDEGRMPAQKI